MLNLFTKLLKLLALFGKWKEMNEYIVVLLKDNLRLLIAMSHLYLNPSYRLSSVADYDILTR